MTNIVNRKVAVPPEPKKSRSKKYLIISAFTIALSGQQAYAGQGDYDDRTSEAYSPYNSISMQLKQRMDVRLQREMNNDAIHFDQKNYKEDVNWVRVPPKMASNQAQSTNNWIDSTADYPIYFD